MRSFRGIMIAGGVVLGLLILAIAIGTLWLNTYIRSEAFKLEIENRASQALGAPVHIQSIAFDILHGVKLQGLVTQIDPSHSGGQGAVQVSVASVNCNCAWLPLLHHELKLTGLTLEKPQIIMTRQANPPPPPQPAAPTSGTAPGGAPIPFQFTLDRAHVSDGSLSIRDATGASMADLNGITASADTSGYFDGGEATATLKIVDIVLPPNVHITGFNTPLSYHNPGQVVAKPFAASIFGGNLAGDYTLGGSEGSIFNLNAQGVDLAQMTQTLQSGSAARLSGALAVQSKWRGIETGVVSGEGEAQVANGKLEGVKILHDLAGVLRVKELDSPVITNAKTHFVVANRQTQFTGLEIDSDGFQMTGSGVIAFDGGLDANMVLILTPRSMAKMPKEVSAFFIQAPDGSGSIAYHLSGTVANPQTDLVMRLFMQNMQIQNAVKKALNKFFH